jgi:hypothetical protein
MTSKGLRRIQIFWALFIGLGALGGGLWFLLDPSGKSMFGMDQVLPLFQVLPLSEKLFQNFTFPGIALLCVNCVPQLAAAYKLLANQSGGATLSLVCGVLLMLWITIQFVIFPLNFMSTAYFAFGALEVLGAGLLIKKRRAETAR